MPKRARRRSWQGWRGSARHSIFWHKTLRSNASEQFTLFLAGQTFNQGACTGQEKLAYLRWIIVDRHKKPLRGALCEVHLESTQGGAERRRQRRLDQGGAQDGNVYCELVKTNAGCGFSLKVQVLRTDSRVDLNGITCRDTRSAIATRHSVLSRGVIWVSVMGDAWWQHLFSWQCGPYVHWVQN